MFTRMQMNLYRIGNSSHSRGLARRAVLASLMAVGAMAALSVLTPAAFGQASSSSDIAGKVTDSTGASVPGAKVLLTNNGTGAQRTTTSNDAGDWSIPNIPPANYKLHIEKSGFKAAEIPSIDVEIGKAANGTVTLNVGAVTDTIEVSTLPPQLQTQESTVGQVIDQKQINDLPLNGRNVLQLATLAPGVSPPQQGQTGTPGQYGTRNLYITVDGGRGSSTNYVLDGTYIRSVRFNNMSIQPNVDTLQEFNLLRSTFSTEYGQGQSVVSMVTKSGTNQIHGSAYEFTRNAIFDARNYFAPAYSTVNGQKVFNPKPDFYRNQFGATIGFPIIKDKLFLFGGYEGQRSQKGTVVTALYPTQNELNGTWDANSSQALPGASGAGGYGYSKTNPAGFTLTSKAAMVLNPTYPVVTSDTASILGTSNYQATAPFTDNYDQYTIRGDWVMSQKSTLFGRYVNFNAFQASPQVTGAVNTNPLLGRNAVLGNTYLITSKIVNEARIGWNEFYNIGLAVIAFPNTQWAAAEGLNFITALNSPRQNGRAPFTINGFGNEGDGAGDQGGQENIYNLGDSISDVLGKHTLKAGFQYQNRRLWQIADNNARGGATFDNCTSATYPAGYKPTSPDDPNVAPGASVGNCPIGSKGYQIGGVNYFYNKFQNYARGMCTSGCNGNDGNTLGHYRDNTYGAFISDIWDAGHNLTVNAGLRWEYNSPFHEQNGLEGSLDPTTGLITFVKIPSVIPVAYDPYINFNQTYAPGIVQPKKLGFMPRVGLSFQARPGTVFRAGYGIYFDNINTNELQFTRYAAPLYFQQAFTNVFTNTLYPNPTTNTQIPSPFSILPNNSRPLTQEWNASVQQDLGHGLILEMAYTGSNTHHSWKRYDQNMYIQYPFQIPTTYVRPYPQFGNGVLTSSTYGAANFNGGSVKIEQRGRNGLYYLGSYQWSKNLDNFSGEAAANDSSYATTMAFDHSYSNFDTRNRAVISGGYQLPFGKGKEWLNNSRIGNAIAGGWSLQPAVQLRTGYPFDVSGSGCTAFSYNGCRVFLAPGRTLASSIKPKQLRGISNWFDPTAFSQDPLVATFAGTPGSYTSAARLQPNLQGWVTRNVGRGPGTASFDFSAIKAFKVYERVNAQFRAEAYNIVNHGIFSNPSGALGTPTSVGKITSTSADNRSIQLALKVLW
jgi:hypothetical protein